VCNGGSGGETPAPLAGVRVRHRDPRPAFAHAAKIPRVPVYANDSSELAAIHRLTQMKIDIAAISSISLVQTLAQFAPSRRR
jgi:uroporphyrinogen-III synthase